jgi:hypothetical protein
LAPSRRYRKLLDGGLEANPANDLIVFRTQSDEIENHLTSASTLRRHAEDEFESTI